MDRPLLFILLSLTSFFFFAPFILQLQSDYSARIWFRTTDPLIKDLDKLEQKFGNDEKVVIGVHAPGGIFKPEIMKVLKDLTEKSWLVPEVVRVDSLTNFNHTRSEEDDLISEPLIPEDAELTQDFLDERKVLALEDKFVKDQFISKDATLSIIYASLKPGINGGTGYREIADAVKAAIAPYMDRSDLSIHLSGSGTVNDAYREVSEGDLKTMLPIMIVVLIIFFLSIFKTIDGIIIPMVLLALTVLATFGFGALNGIKFDNLSSALPGILIAICIADSVHVLVAYYRYLKDGLSKKEAAIASLDKNFIPTFLTSFSTMIGFLSLSTTELLPVKHLGYLAAFGTFYAWLMTIFLIIPCLPYIPYRPLGFAKNLLIIPEPKDSLVNFVLSKRNFIFFFVIITALLGLYIGTLNEVNSDPLVHFSKRLKVRQDSDFLKTKLGGVGGPEIIIDSQKPDGVKSPEFMRKIDTFKEWVEEFSFVNKVISVSEIVKQVYKNLNRGDPNYYKIPETQNEIAEVLLFYSMGLPEGMSLNNRMSLDYRYLRQSIFWNLTDSKSSLKAIDQIYQKAKELGLNITITGKLTLYHRMTNYIVETFFKSISVAIILISILMIIVLRSWKLGLLSLLPNVIPLFYGVGIMTILQRPIDIGTSLVVSVCLGIAVDDTVHFLTHYRFLLKDGISPMEALKKVMKHTAPALTYTTVILAIGFGVFAFADFVPNVNFGVLCAIILSAALFIDLVFLPAILLKFKIKA